MKCLKINNKMENEIKRIDIKEFREKGYLQEINRRFLLEEIDDAIEIIKSSVDCWSVEKEGVEWQPLIKSLEDEGGKIMGESADE